MIINEKWLLICVIAGNPFCPAGQMGFLLLLIPKICEDMIGESFKEIRTGNDRGALACFWSYIRLLWASMWKSLSELQRPILRRSPDI